MVPICVIAGDMNVGESAGSCAGLSLVGAASPAPPAQLTSIAFASPKSSTFTVPSRRILMFAGFRSR